MAFDERRFIDAAGPSVTLPERGWTAVELEGRPVAALGRDPALDEAPEHTRARGAAALALEDQRLWAELRAGNGGLRGSREPLIEAGDAERRRLGRDLHDGAQSRLVALALTRGRTPSREGDPEVAAIL